SRQRLLALQECCFFFRTWTAHVLNPPAGSCVGVHRRRRWPPVQVIPEHGGWLVRPSVRTYVRARSGSIKAQGTSRARPVLRDPASSDDCTKVLLLCGQTHIPEVVQGGCLHATTLRANCSQC